MSRQLTVIAFVSSNFSLRTAMTFPLFYGSAKTKMIDSQDNAIFANDSIEQPPTSQFKTEPTCKELPMINFAMFYAFHKTCIFFRASIRLAVVLLNKPLLWNLEFFPNWLSPFSWSSPERLNFFRSLKLLHLPDPTFLTFSPDFPVNLTR